MSVKDQPENAHKPLPEYCQTCPYHERVTATIDNLKEEHDNLRGLAETVAGIKTTVEKVAVTADKMSAALVGTLDAKGLVPRTIDLELKVKLLEERELAALKADVQALKDFKIKLLGMAAAASVVASVLIAILAKIDWKKIL